jgi:hypothetical protein
MDILKFLFGSGWLIGWYVAMWVFGALFVALPVHALAKDALKVPVPTASLGTMGVMILPLFFYAVVLTINGALAVKGFDFGIWGRFGIVLGIVVVGLGLLCTGFGGILSYPGKPSVIFLWSISIILMIASLVLMWMGRKPVAGSAGGVFLTILMVVVAIPVLLFLFGIYIELRKR